MRINNIPNNMYVYNQSNAGKHNFKAADVQKQTYDIKISDKGAEYQFALKKAMEASDFRVDKVNELKAKVQSGTYNVSAREIANKMVEEATFQRYF